MNEYDRKLLRHVSLERILTNARWIAEEAGTERGRIVAEDLEDVTPALIRLQDALRNGRL